MGKKLFKCKYLIEEFDNDLSSDDDSDWGYDMVFLLDSEDEIYCKDFWREKCGRDERCKILSGNKKSKLRCDFFFFEEEDDEDVFEWRRIVDRIKKRVCIDEWFDKGFLEIKGN